MSHPDAPEARTIDVDVENIDTRGRTLHGYAAVYGPLSADLGGFRERIAPGAFSDVLPTADVRALLNHDPSQVLGRTRAGTLRLVDDTRGLRFECDLPDSPLGENVREAVRRGDIDGASFRFKVATEEWDGDVRTVSKVKELADVTVATYGAYPDASVELRTRPTDTNTANAEEDTNTMENTDDTEDRTTTGGLAVEDRAAAGETLEDRITEAFQSIRKGETRSLTTTSAAAIAPAELSTFLFDKLRASSVALASGIRVIPTNRDSISFPKLSTDVAPAFYNELDAITPGDPAFTTLTGTPRKIAHLVALANEVIDDSEPPAVDVLRAHLATMLGLKLDVSLFEGSGAAPAIRGLKNVAGIQTVSQGANGAPLSNLDAIADAIALLEAANVPGPYAVVMTPRSWGEIRKLKDTTGAPLVAPTYTVDTPPSIFGARVFVSGQLSITESQGTSTDASSIYVYAPSQVVLVRRQDASIELDRSRLFNQDASEIRGTLRADLIVPNPTAIVRIVGVR